MVEQFDIVSVNLDPTKGKEKGKYCPCVVISNNLVNKGSDLQWIVPITSREKRYPTDIDVRTDRDNVKGIIDTAQIRTLDLKARNAKVIDHLDRTLHRNLIDAIHVQTEIIN